MNRPHTSIRYDLSFLEAVLRLTDAQLDAQNNPNDSGPTLTQEADCNEAMMLLCDMIDLYVARRLEAAKTEAAPHG